MKIVYFASWLIIRSLSTQTLPKRQTNKQRHAGNERSSYRRLNASTVHASRHIHKPYVFKKQQQPIAKQFSLEDEIFKERK